LTYALNVAYDEHLAERVRRALARERAVVEKNMFGGLTFVVRGHMCCGVVGNELMLRVGPDLYDEALQRPYTREMDFTGRSLRGMVYVGPKGVRDDASVRAWVADATAYVRTLPARPERQT
jgi:hypothetical protein